MTSQTVCIFYLITYLLSLPKIYCRLTEYHVENVKTHAMSDNVLKGKQTSWMALTLRVESRSGQVHREVLLGLSTIR